MTTFLSNLPWWAFVLLAGYVWVACIVYSWQRNVAAVGKAPQWYDRPAVVAVLWFPLTCWWVSIWLRALWKGSGRF